MKNFNLKNFNLKSFNLKRKNNLKLFAAAVVIIGVGTLFLGGAADAVMAANLSGTQTIPTGYQIPASAVPGIPEGYRQADYHVKMDDLNVGTPTTVDLTMEAAAELGAQYLWKVYELNLENANVFMSYNPGTETFPRAFWTGDVLFTDMQTPDATRWSFWIDAVTGELFNIGHSEKLKVEVPLGLDAALEKDYSAYAELAKKHVERCNLMNSPISQVTYNCQGYSGNNPDITLNVTGEKGEVVIISFSRYDQSLLGIITDSSRKVSDSVDINHIADEVKEVKEVEWDS